MRGEAQDKSGVAEVVGQFGICSGGRAGLQSGENTDHRGRL